MKIIMSIINQLLLIGIILIEAILGVLASVLLKKVTGKHEKYTGQFTAYISTETMVGFSSEIRTE